MRSGGRVECNLARNRIDARTGAAQCNAGSLAVEVPRYPKDTVIGRMSVLLCCRPLGHGHSAPAPSAGTRYETNQSVKNACQGLPALPQLRSKTTVLAAVTGNPYPGKSVAPCLNPANPGKLVT
jgi:hypothetical protein